MHCRMLLRTAIFDNSYFMSLTAIFRGRQEYEKDVMNWRFNIQEFLSLFLSLHFLFWKKMRHFKISN